MVRLFVAVDVPDAALSVLKSLQPLPCPGMRVIPETQMHLTLHFLGEMPLELTVTALLNITASRFTLTIDDVGSFPSMDRGAILWAGIRPNPELMYLHSAIAGALLSCGFRPESRRYHPHVTLARCRPNVPKDVIHRFLNQAASFRPVDFVVDHITLYSSVLRPEGPEYREERRIALS